MITISVRFYRGTCIARIEGTEKRGTGGCVGDAIGALLIQYPEDFSVQLDCEGMLARAETPAPALSAPAATQAAARVERQGQTVRQASLRTWAGGLRFVHELGM